MKESTPNERADFINPAPVNADKTKTTEGIPRFIKFYGFSVNSADMYEQFETNQLPHQCRHSGTSWCTRVFCAWSRFAKA